jgi:hypothetical protein
MVTECFDLVQFNDIYIVMIAVIKYHNTVLRIANCGIIKSDSQLQRLKQNFDAITIYIVIRFS